MKKILTKILVILSLLSTCHCAVSICPDCVKNGKKYGWHGGNFLNKWDDYYRCALSYSEGECYELALIYLIKSIELRYKDQWMARRYGLLHFINYFPHREKGIVHYYLNEYEKAEIELLLSIKHASSAKAHFYLDKVRRERMVLEKQQTTKPVIQVSVSDNIISNSGEIWTAEDSVPISGTVKDEQYVSKVDLAKIPIFMENSTKQFSFRELLNLKQGKHNIDIVAKNLLGGTSKHRIVINVDRSGPVIVIQRVELNYISGFLYDESGEISLEINEIKSCVPTGQFVPFYDKIHPQKKFISLIAKDRIGNLTKVVINKKDACFNINLQFIAQSSQLMSDDDNLHFRQNSIKPDILMDENYNNTTVYENTIRLKGKVKGSNIESLFINNINYPVPKGLIICFSHAIDLSVGKNVIQIKATDKAGNFIHKQLIVNRRISEIKKNKYRYSVAIHLFENLYGQINVAQFKQFLENEFYQERRFQLVAPNVNRTKTPQSCLLGYITKRHIHNKIGVEVFARLIETKTSRILGIKYHDENAIFKDVYEEFLSEITLQNLSKNITNKFHKQFPLLEGKIVNKSNSIIIAEILQYEDIPDKWNVIIGTDTKIYGTGQILNKNENGQFIIDLLTGKNKVITTDHKVILQ